MQHERNKPKRMVFPGVVALSAAAVAAIAGWASPALSIGFGFALLFAGIILGGLGAWLAFPNSQDYRNPRNRVFLYIDRLFFDRPNEFAADQMAYDREHSAPLWGFEDVMVWAGLADILMGIVLIVLRKQLIQHS